MWKRSFVATTVALGGTLEDALAATSDADTLGGSMGHGPVMNASLDELVATLRAPQRSTRAAGLAKAVRDIVLAIDERTLR